MTKARTLRERVRQTNGYTRKLHELRTAPPPKYAPPRRTLGGHRDDLGVIVTMCDQKTGLLISAHEPGQRLEALRRIALRIDADPRDLRIVCYSTPETVTGDLQGERDPRHLPEVHALARIGRRDLLDPTLPKTDEHGRYR